MNAVTSLAPAVQNWLRSLDDAALRDEFDGRTFERASAYARSNRVLLPGTAGDPQVLQARVIGSRSQLYTTSVRPYFNDLDDPDYWTTECSCPIGGDCKHAVALIITARKQLNHGRESAPLPTADPRRSSTSWERLLSPLATVEPAEEPRPLALQLDLYRSESRWTGSQPRLMLRPMTRGKRNTWIKTGVSWEQLLGNRQTVPVVEEQRRVLRRMRVLADANGPGYRYGSGADLGLGEIGPELWSLLAEAQQLGVELLLGSGLSAFDIDAEPARIELRATDLPSGVRLQPELSIGGQVQEPGQTHLLGMPAFGCFVLVPSGTGSDLRLARFEKMLDPAVANLFRSGGVDVPVEQVPRLTTDFLPGVRQRLAITGDLTALREPTVTGPMLAITVAANPGHRLALTHSFRYLVNDRPVDVRSDTLTPISPGLPRRAVADEQELLRGLDCLDTVPGLISIRADRSRRLATSALLAGADTARYVELVLPRLLADDRVLVTQSDDLPSYNHVTEAPLITVSATDPEEGSGTDWFDLGVTVSVAGENVPFQPLFTALVAGDDHLFLDSGTWFSLDRPELAQLRDLIEEARGLSDPDSPGLRLNRLHAGLWEELVALGVVGEQSARWQQSVGSLIGLTEIPDPLPPDRLKAELRPYQQRGYAWLSLLWDHELGGILADDMGLGKTVQTLALAQRAKENGELEQPLLVVCPTSVIGTWAEQAETFCPDLRVATVTTTARRREAEIAELAKGCDILVTSYTLLRLEAADYHQLSWAGMILDEAQAVKNYRGKTYQAVRRVRAPFRLAITGTPLENSLMDLWALLSLTAPGLYPNPETFADDYRRPIEQGGDVERLARLRRRIRPLMLRRRKEEVAPELPPKVEQVLAVELSAAHRRVYSRQLQRERQRVLGMLDDVQRNRIAIFRALTKLRQLALAPELVDAEHASAGSSKLDAVMEHIGEVVAEGHRALIFSQFTGFLSLLRRRLDAAGIAYEYLDGRTRKRAERIAAFRTGDAPLFLISLKAGGFGLTLTEADYVFVLDPWWNPAAEEQAIDRTHRIGQQRTVMVYRLVATDTIEEKVVALQERKRRLFGDVIEGEGGGSAPLTADDIRELLRG
ncbi:MAG: DEAD/DEAH box helicase [Microlunatus sp.]